MARYIGPAAPEIAVEQPAETNLTNGASVSCGTAEVGGPLVVRTFTVRNVGTSRLTGLALSKDGANASDFTVGPLGAGAGITELPMGTRTTFTVTFTPSASGSRLAAIHIVSNDADENPFDIMLVGTGLAPLAITTGNPLPVGTVGAGYSLAQTASGGIAPYVWSVISGNLPAGLSLSSAGVLSGTPTQGTNATFSVRLSDAGATSPVTNAFSIRILESTVPGAIDITFGGNGWVATAIGGSNDVAAGLALQSDGKFVVAGSSFNGSNWDFALAQFLTNGDPDTTFGNGGRVITPIGSSHDNARGVALQSDGKILVAGNAQGINGGDFALVRYSAAGTLDTTFGSGGKVVTSIGAASTDMGWGVAVQSDGKILVVGDTDDGPPPYDKDVAVVRYLPNGSLDSTFGTGGKVVTPVGDMNDYGLRVAVQRDGKIVVSGWSVFISDTNKYITLLRYQTNGTLDSGFGNGGKVLTAMGTIVTSAQGLVLQEDGKIVVASSFSSSGGFGDSDFALVRYLADGSLDASFGTGGKVITDFASGSDDSGNSVALQSDGKIVVAGSCQNGGNSDFAVARYLPNGTLDPTFGDGGKMITPVGGFDDYGASVVVQRDGKIVVAGTAESADGNTDFALVRYLGTTAPEIAVEYPAGDDLTDGNATVDFGTLVLDSVPVTHMFTVRNVSSTNLTGLAVGIDGANAGDFKVRYLGGDTLGPGASTFIGVTFRPGAVGARTAAIHIASNDADENPFDITLTGTGVEAPPPNATIYWTGGGDGFTWTNGPNWSRGSAPGSADDAAITGGAGTNVVVYSGSITVRSLQCTKAFTLGGGTFKLTAGPSQFSGAFTISNGATLTVSGATASLTASGVTTDADGAFTAEGGGAIHLPNLTSLVNSNRFTTCQVDGAGSLLDFSGLTNILLASGDGVYVKAYNGGIIDLSRVTSANGRVQVYAEDAGSLVDLSGLTGRWRGRGNGTLSLEASAGAVIWMPNVTELEWASLTVGNTGWVSTAQLRLLTNATITVNAAAPDFGRVTNIDDTSVFADNGGVARLPNVFRATHGNQFPKWQANGMGSLVDLSRLTNIVFGPSQAVYVNAYAGGVVDLHGAVSANGRVEVQAEDAGSLVDLSGLTGRWKGRANAALSLEARTGAVILIPNVTELESASVTVGDTGRVAAAQLRLLTNATITADAAVPDFGAVTNIDDTSVFALNGGVARLTNVWRATHGNQFPRWQAKGTGSLVDLSGLLEVSVGNAERLYVESLSAGQIDLHRLICLCTGPTRVLADGTNSVIDLTGASSFISLGSGSSDLTARNGGRILFNNQAILLANVTVSIPPGEPILPATLAASPAVNLYALTGHTYVVEGRDPRSDLNPWVFAGKVGMTNSPQVFASAALPNQELRVHEMAPPSLALMLTPEGQVQIIVYDTPGNTNQIWSSASVGGDATWQPGVVTVMTNTFQILPPIAPSDSTRFYRAKRL